MKNDTVTAAGPPPAGSPSSADLRWNLAASVMRHAREAPGRTALVVDGRSLTYAGLAAEAARVAAWLRRRIPFADGAATPLVGVVASRSLETYAGMLGAAWAGAAWVPLHPAHPPARLVAALDRAKPAALLLDAAGSRHLADAAFAARVPGACLVATPEPAGSDVATSPGSGAASLARYESWQGLAVAPEGFDPVPRCPQESAYVIFTSGTTGTPKGVVVSCRAARAFLDRAASIFGIHAQDRVGQFCEPSFDVSVFEIFAAFDGGAALHVLPASATMAPAPFVRREALTVWTSVPSVVSVLSRMKLLEPGSLPSLRATMFIGEGLLVEAARAWQRAAPGAVIGNHYGPTEAAVACTWQPVGEPAVETPGRGTVAIGRPYDGVTVEVLGDDGRFLPDGDTGELVLHGEQLADGYLHEDALTAERFPTLRHPRLGPSRWYRTGDLGYRDADGVLHCLGRSDHQVKVMGHRVELEDLEAHLRAASGSDDVAAVAWPRTAAGAEGIVAFVRAPLVDVPAIRARLRDAVPPYMVPRRVVEVDELPRTLHGKVDRRALGERLERGIA